MVVVTYEGFLLRLVKSLVDLIIYVCELTHTITCIVQFIFLLIKVVSSDYQEDK